MRLLRLGVLGISGLAALPLAAQVQPPFQVGAFGGMTAALPPIPVPPELKAIVPEGCVLRAVMQTKMAQNGETTILFDGGESDGTITRIHSIRDGHDFELFEGPTTAIAGLVFFSLEPNRQAVGFAYHRAGDQDDTWFHIFAAVGESYAEIFRQHTTQGQMRIAPGANLSFVLWSADHSLDPHDPDKSCVWCQHFYRIRTYAWQGDKFQSGKRRTSPSPLDPGDLAAQPFVFVDRKPGKQKR